MREGECVGNHGIAKTAMEEPVSEFTHLQCLGGKSNEMKATVNSNQHNNHLRVLSKHIPFFFKVSIIKPHMTLGFINYS